jgi:hypothetical protein
VLVKMLTTTDNPFDPFDQWDDWYSYDTRLGYNSSSLLARVAVVSDDMSDSDQVEAINAAIDEIVSENVSGVHTSADREYKADEPDAEVAIT